MSSYNRNNIKVQLQKNTPKSISDLSSFMDDSLLLPYTMNYKCNPCFILHLSRTDIYVEAEVKLGTVNASSGTYVAARISKGGCNSFAAQGIFFYVMPGQGILVTGDLGKFGFKILHQRDHVTLVLPGKLCY